MDILGKFHYYITYLYKQYSQLSRMHAFTYWMLLQFLILFLFSLTVKQLSEPLTQHPLNLDQSWFVGT